MLPAIDVILCARMNSHSHNQTIHHFGDLECNIYIFNIQKYGKFN